MLDRETVERLLQNNLDAKLNSELSKYGYQLDAAHKLFRFITSIFERTPPELITWKFKVIMPVGDWDFSQKIILNFHRMNEVFTSECAFIIHIYFRLLYVHCRYRQSAMYIQNDRGSAEDAQILDELRQLPEQLPLYQQQIQRFFELVLDVDSAGREPQAQAAKNYFHDSPKDPDLFSFRPIPLSFEPVEPGRCSPVLYSSSIRDMIDYSLRSCVERNITVRRCKNCGRWFPQTGRVSAEYCERPVPRGEQVCREIGAFKQWTKKQSDDPIFKAYRKEYKRRFAWIKAGRITDEAFYAWSEKAREEKQKCDRDIISLAEFQQWLKESK